MENIYFMRKDWVTGTRTYDCPECGQYDIEETEVVQCDEIHEACVVSDGCRYFDLKPIEIDDERLLLNGFGRHQFERVGDGYCFDLMGESGIVMSVGPIKYVSQLQQCLRICGEAERADRFIIRKQ